jgi:hypothetical protein
LFVATAYASRNLCRAQPLSSGAEREGNVMNSIIYIIGPIVVIAAVLSFFGLR